LLLPNSFSEFVNLATGDFPTIDRFKNFRKKSNFDIFHYSCLQMLEKPSTYRRSHRTKPFPATEIVQINPSTYLQPGFGGVFVAPPSLLVNLILDISRPRTLKEMRWKTIQKSMAEDRRATIGARYTMLHWTNANTLGGGDGVWINHNEMLTSKTVSNVELLKQKLLQRKLASLFLMLK